jgi:hypothetical protein
MTLSPVAAALQSAHTPGFTAYDLVPANWWLMAALSMTLLAFVTSWTWKLYRPE